MSELYVAVGASAVSTASLELFLKQLDLRDDMAVVVVMQNREALDEADLRASLAEAGRELTAVREGASIEAGRIYLPDANTVVTVEKGNFRVAQAEPEPGTHGSIDSFLVSMANDEARHAIAVLFAGTGGDGTLGVTAIKQAGGLTLAEATRETEEHDLSASNSPAAIVDLLVPAADLAATVEKHIASFAEPEGRLAASDEGDVAATLTAIATILRNKTGHDFHGYKQGTFLRRIQRRMQVALMPEPADYVELLRGDAEEAQHLFNDLLIGVTQFFRDRKEFEYLAANVIPKLFEGKTRADQLRVWVIGCSTGEEAYSIAILLREHMATRDEVPQVQIFATDLDGRALASARVGRYPESIAKDLSAERLGRWFIKEGATYSVVKEIREMCIFSQHSVIKDAPFSRLDLVSCRNLLIYLDIDLQTRVIPLFHFALKESGYLFLGNSENVSRHTELFAAVESRLRVYQRVNTGTRVLPDFPFTSVDRRLINPPASAQRPRTNGGNLARSVERISERYAPSYVVIDTAFNILHFSGRTGRYIEPAGGAASLNLLNLVHPDLRLGLRVALSRAVEENEVVRLSDLRMETNGDPISVDVVVEPVQGGRTSPHVLVVLFKESPISATLRDTSALSPSEVSDQRVRQLERELRAANERLQATVEELESTNEELKSSNEEYQSLNEELQSANEELETSKEELQSVNEELTTVNGELAHRVQELGRANSDLKNLLESTQIATVFLDNQLRVMNFTPAVTELFHLVETDIGRPIGHIKSRIAYNELQDDVRRVLRTLGSVDREITASTTASRYIVRVLPYRSVDNFIGGVVITFTNTTPLTEAQTALHESEKRMRLLLEGIPQLVWRSGEDGQWTWSSQQWMRFTGQTQEQSLGFGWMAAVHPDDRERVTEAWSKACEVEGLDIDHRVQAADGTYVWHHTRSAPVRADAEDAPGEGRILEWLGTTTDVQELKKLQESQAVLVTELQHRTRNLLGVVRSLSDRTLKSSGSLDDFKMRFNARLAALSRVQGLLSRVEHEPITIETLVRLELDALGAEVDGDRVQVGGPGVSLRPRIVQTFALALHELATNARKHGALSHGDGQLSVSWKTVGQDGSVPRLQLAWVERGISHDGGASYQGATQRGGYGRELIEKALPYSLGAETSFRFVDTGLECLIDLPLSKLPPDTGDER